MNANLTYQKTPHHEVVPIESVVRATRICVVVIYGPMVAVWIIEGFSLKSTVFFVLLTAVFVFIAHLFLMTRYIIEGSRLIVKCGLFTYKPIDIKEVRKISKTSSVISAPAPSFDRIEIRYGKYGTVILSPQGQASFVEDLMTINPSIEASLDRSNQEFLN